MSSESCDCKKHIHQLCQDHSNHEIRDEYLTVGRSFKHELEQDNILLVHVTRNSDEFQCCSLRNNCTLKFIRMKDAQTILVHDAKGSRFEIPSRAVESYAIKTEGHTSIAKLVIEKGTTSWSGELKGACFGGHVSIAKLMIEKGATNWDQGLSEACREIDESDKEGGNSDDDKDITETEFPGTEECIPQEARIPEEITEELTDEWIPQRDDHYYGKIPSHITVAELATRMALGVSRYRQDAINHGITISDAEIDDILDMWFEHDANDRHGAFDHLVPEDAFESFIKLVKSHCHD